MDDGGDDAGRPGRRPYTRAQTTGLGLAAFFLLAAAMVPPPWGLGGPAWWTVGIGLAMAVLWVTEAVPIPATALLPLVLFPLTGVAGVGEAAAPYSNKLIFLFLGGFVIALAMERWQLHRRLALIVILAVGGGSRRRLVMGFMLATGVLSMWVSNTATALMMFPIALSVIVLVERGGPAEDGESGRFAIALLLAIAYGANIGGMGTLIGTPPNTVLAATLSEVYGIEIGFGQWMLVGVPLVAVGLPATYWLLTRITFPISGASSAGTRSLVRAELDKLGPLQPAEKSVLFVFLVTAAAWIAGPWLRGFLPGMDDAVIAMAAAVLLFFLPARDGHGSRVMDWVTAERLPWGVLLLFGGGLSLAAAVQSTQLAEAIGGAAGALGGAPVVVLVAAVAFVVLFLTELTSNTATTTALVPVLGAVAVGLGESPILLTVPAALAASAAFMLPVATPPNAVVFGSGKVPLPAMARAGLFVNLLFAVLIPVVTLLLAEAVLGR